MMRSSPARQQLTLEVLLVFYLLLRRTGSSPTQLANKLQLLAHFSSLDGDG